MSNFMYMIPDEILERMIFEKYKKLIGRELKHEDEIKERCILDRLIEESDRRKNIK